MANSYIIDIGINDSLPDVIRKTNQNFRRISADQSKQATGAVRREADRADQAIAGAVDTINQAMEAAIAQINLVFDQRMTELNELIAEIETKQSELNTDISNLRTDIAGSIYGATVNNKRISIPAGTKIPVGNINIFSNASKSGYIRTSASEEDNDLWAQA